MVSIPYLNWRGRKAPILKVVLERGERQVSVIAYADTGATYSVFAAGFGRRLGLEVEDGERLDLTVGNGDCLTIHLHTLVVKIEDLEFEAPIGFSDRLGTGIALLGREGLLDEVVVCFDARSGELTLER